MTTTTDGARDSMVKLLERHFKAALRTYGQWDEEGHPGASLVAALHAATALEALARDER